MIYHIADRAAWEKAQQEKFYVHESIAKEGFIHCSTGEQLEATANRYFKSEPSILILVIDPNKVDAEIKLEESVSSKGLYHHIYGPLPVQAVVAWREFERSPDGLYHLNTR
jgi:uncharacterized protein (DUF952 family)